MKILSIALLGSSLLVSGEAFASYLPEGNGRIDEASYAAPEGNGHIDEASYAAPEGNGNIQLG
jgi:hypothetical protein